MQSSFIEMCEKSMEQDNARFERSAEMFRDAQSRQMEQTNAIVDIFKDLASKQLSLSNHLSSVIETIHTIVVQNSCSNHSLF